jgi:hypothetical protein
MICSEVSDVRFAKLLADFRLLWSLMAEWLERRPGPITSSSNGANCDELDLARPWQNGKLCEDRFWHSSDDARSPANRPV